MKASVASRIKQRLQEFTGVLEGDGVIQEQFTCRKVELDLRPKRYDPRMVRKTRKILRASQRVFALLLGVSVKTIQAWEQGLFPPKPMACRFMDEIRRNPQYWITRIRESLITKTDGLATN